MGSSRGRVELVWEARFEVVTPAFRLGPVNDTDRALQPAFSQQPRRLVICAKIEPETWHFCCMAKFLVAPGQTRTNMASLRGIPAAFCNYGEASTAGIAAA